EQKRGVFAVAPEVDDYVDSLVENGVKVQVQLMYGNPMYTSPGGKRVDWNDANPEEYGRLLAAFAPAVHETDPSAKVIYGGQADPISDYAKRALDECKCASQIDVFAYHTYPGYGQNMHPESMDSGAYGVESPAKLRALVRGYPGIRKDLEFWDDEFNSIPSWPGSDESVQ